MKKYKKIITGLILGLICAILPFVAVVKAKALTVEEITSINDLKNTKWSFNSNFNDYTISSNNSYIIYANDSSLNIANFYYGENLENEYILYSSGENYPFISLRTIKTPSMAYCNITLRNSTSNTIQVNESSTNAIKSIYSVNELRFKSWNNGEVLVNDESLFLERLKAFATFQGVVENEPTTRTIPFRISLITNVFGEGLEYINSSIINLPVFDDTVSFTVSFENNKMINGQINHPEVADELGELTFSNGEQVFYTIYYNETNIEFKLYFYGEQLFLYEAVMYNTEVLDSGGNYQATVATYSEGISEQEMQTLKNSGIYEASFNITIPQEDELVTDSQLMLEIGILEGSDPPGFDNITNIMTGIFTLVSSFLSIQLGFITLGQIIGLVLAIGVIFFIFYVWNGGRNGN